jgi:hypothetical protein
MHCLASGGTGCRAGVAVTAQQGPVTRALRGFANEDRGDRGGSHRELAERICRACVAGTGVDGAAMSVLTATEHRVTLSGTDATAARLEDLQFTLGEGACIEAATSGRPVLIPDLHDHVLTTCWPVFATAVTEQTLVRALFALPLQLGTINVGVLDLYRGTPGPLRGPELRDLVAAVDTATVLLLGAHTRDDTDDPPDLPPDDTPSPDERQNGRLDGQQTGRLDRDRLDRLWSNRAEVHRATGMILVQLDVPGPDAFARLRAYAFARQRPLGEVARDVLAGRLVFTEDMD